MLRAELSWSLKDFVSSTGDPRTAPYDPTTWRRVDAMVAAAGAAGMHVDLSLDYRNILWKNCIDPYTADWSSYIDFVARRVNTVTGRTYGRDPTIAIVSVAGEPLPTGIHRYKADATGRSCTVKYTTEDLTRFYRSTTDEWVATGSNVLVNTGGLGYLNEKHSGIDWRTIFRLPHNTVCDIKTYGGMQAWAPTAFRYCATIRKPVVVEEFGWQQKDGDRQRAALFTRMLDELRPLGVAGAEFWNLGYQTGPDSYEVNPSTPGAFAAVRAQAPVVGR